MSKIQINPFRNPIASSNLVDYANYTGLHFRDSVTGDLCWIYGDSGGNHTYLVTQTAQDVAPTLVATVTNSYMTMVASAQDASGYVHFLCYYSYQLSHSKGTLTRSGGHVTGLSLSAAIALPTMTSSLGGSVWAGTIDVINNGSSAERVMIVCIDGSDSTQYAGAFCHSSTSPTATSDFLSLAGTASTWTKFPTQTCSANVGAAYCFNASIEQYGSSGHFFADCGAASRGDVGDYSTALTGYRCTASGSTWTVDTANPCVLATETDESLCGHSCKDASGNAYFAWTQRTGTAAVTVGLAKVASDGTFTASWVSTTATNGGEIRAFPAVCSDGTVILALGMGDTGSATTQYEIQAYSGGSWYTYLSTSTRWVLATDLNWIDRGSRGWQDGLVLSIGASAYPATVSIGSVALRSSSAGNVYYDNYSLPAYSGTATLSPTYAFAVPHATRDMHVCIAAQKSTSSAGGTITFPSGWTERGEILGAGRYAPQAVDTGNVDISIATKDSVDGTETGSISVTLGSYNTAWGMMLRLTKDGDGDWAFASTTGSDVTGGAALSVVYDSTIDLAPGDLVVIGWCQPTDVTSPKQFTAQALSASGITFSEVTVLSEPDSTTGNDVGGWVGFARVLAGTGTVTPTFSATAGGTTTNVRGGSVLLRVRESSSVVIVAVEGASNGTTAVSADLHMPVWLVGQSDGVSSIVADTNNFHRLSGAINGVSTVTGIISTFFVGRSDGVSSAQGTLGVLKAMQLHINSRATVIGTLRHQGLMNVACNGVATVLGAITVTRETVFLAGSSAGNSTVVGDGTLLRVLTRLLSGVPGQATVTGTLLCLSPVGGSSNGVASVIGALKVQTALVAASVGSSIVAGDFYVVIKLAGLANGWADVQGSLYGVIKLMTSTVNGQATVSGSLVVAAQLLIGASAGVSAAQGALLVQTSLAGLATGVAAADAELAVLRPVVGAANGVSTVVGTVSITRGVVATVSAAATVAGTTNVTKALRSAITGVATVAASLDGLVPVAGTSVGQAYVYGVLSELQAWSGVSAGVSTVTAGLPVLRPLAGQSTGLSTVDASMLNMVWHEGRADGVALVSALIQAQKVLEASSNGQSAPIGALWVVKKMMASSFGLSSPVGTLNVEGLGLGPTLSRGRARVRGALTVIRFSSRTSAKGEPRIIKRTFP